MVFRRTIYRLFSTLSNLAQQILYTQTHRPFCWFVCCDISISTHIGMSLVDSFICLGTSSCTTSCVLVAPQCSLTTATSGLDVSVQHLQCTPHDGSSGTCLLRDLLHTRYQVADVWKIRIYEYKKSRKVRSIWVTELWFKVKKTGRRIKGRDANEKSELFGRIL